MESSAEEFDVEWVEALKKLAKGLDDDEALQLIVADKESTLEAQGPKPRDINNNIVKTSSSGNISSVQDPGKQKENLIEGEIIKMIDELKIEDSSVPVKLSRDGSAQSVEDKSKNVS